MPLIYKEMKEMLECNGIGQKQGIEENTVQEIWRALELRWSMFQKENWKRWQIIQKSILASMAKRAVIMKVDAFCSKVAEDF